jgi:uncharacterized membrane protein
MGSHPLISPNGISIRLRLRGYTELGSNFWFACPIPSSVVSAIYGALEWLITVVINFLYIPGIMESPPYDTPIAQHTMIPSFHQFNLKAFWMQVVWVLCKIILLKIINGHAILAWTCSELAWQLRDNAVQRFCLTLDLGFWRIVIVRIEDNVLRSKSFKRLCAK